MQTHDGATFWWQEARLGSVMPLGAGGRRRDEHAGTAGAGGGPLGLWLALSGPRPS